MTTDATQTNPPVLGALSSRGRGVATNELAFARGALREATEYLEHVADILQRETTDEADG